MLIKVEMPVKAGNAMAKNGTLGTTIQSILNEQKPEAAYFTEMNGTRTGLIFVNMNNPSDLPAFAEPWFLAFNAKTSFHPAMVPEDLAKAAPAIEQAAKNKLFEGTWEAGFLGDEEKATETASRGRLMVLDAVRKGLEKEFEVELPQQSPARALVDTALERGDAGIVEAEVDPPLAKPN